MIRLNSVMNQFDDVINDVNNELSAEPKAVGSATQYEKRTTALEGEGTSSMTRQTTTLVINVKQPVEETLVEEASETNLESGVHDKDEHGCDVCAKKSDFPPLILPQSTQKGTSPLAIAKSSALSDASSMMSISSTETDDTIDIDSDDKSNDETVDFSEADLALENMLDELCKLTAESFYDEEKNDIRKSTHSSGSFTARKRQSRLKPPSLTEEQKLRFSIANFVDGGTSAQQLDELLDEEEEVEEGEMTRTSASRMKGLFEDLGIDELEAEKRKSQKRERPPQLLISEAADLHNSNTDVFSYNQDSLGVPRNHSDLSPVTPKPTEISPETLRHEELIITMLNEKKLNPDTEDGRKQAKKIRIALEKIKEASLGKIVVKVWNDERSILENIEVDTTMTTRHLTKKMCRREGIKPGPEWCIAEKLPGLFMDRILQDSDYVCQAVSDWSRNVDNHFVFLKRSNRYRLFRDPHSYLATDLSVAATESGTFTEESKKILLEEFFTKEATQVPNTEGILWMKEGSKKWRRHYFVLRPSGIYYTPKGKQKTHSLALLASFEHYNVYTCQGYKFRFKAPYDHVFAVKHPQVQTSKSKHVHVLCASTREERNRWITFIRMAKYGYSMYEDYLVTKEEELALATGRGKSKKLNNSENKTSELNVDNELESKSSTRSSPRLPRNQLSAGHASTFPRSREASPKPPPRDQGSATLPRTGGDPQPKERLTSTSSAPPDLMPPPPPPTASVPNVVPYGEQRKKSRRKKKSSGSGGEGGAVTWEMGSGESMTSLNEQTERQTDV